MYLDLAFCFLFWFSVLELYRTVDHCSSTVSLDSFSVVDVVGRVLFHYGPYTTSFMNRIHFKVMIFHIYRCRKAYMKTK